MFWLFSTARRPEKTSIAHCSDTNIRKKTCTQNKILFISTCRLCPSWLTLHTFIAQVECCMIAYQFLWSPFFLVHLNHLVVQDWIYRYTKDDIIWCSELSLILCVNPPMLFTIIHDRTSWVTKPQIWEKQCLRFIDSTSIFMTVHFFNC